MPAHLRFESDSLCVLHFSGVLKHSEFCETQNALGQKIDAGVRPRLLAILGNFDGWEPGANWGDADFLISHGGEIAKIAIVGEERWREDALAFAGEGFRDAPVRFFAPDQEPGARAWLA